MAIDFGSHFFCAKKISIIVKINETLFRLLIDLGGKS